MASIREILKGYVQKKALKHSTSINERSGQIISSSDEIPEKRKKTSACNIFSHQTTSLPITPAHLVPLLGEISTQTDVKKKALKNTTSINEQSNQMISSCKIYVSSVELEKRKTTSAPNMFSHQTTSLPITSACLVPLLGQISTQTDVLKIQINNVQGTPSTKKAIDDDLAQKRETFNMVGHQTTSLPLTSAYPVPSRRDIYSKEDVLKIKISNVQGTPSNKNALKAFSHDLNSNQCHVLHRDGSNQNVKSRYVNDIQEKMPLPEQFRNGQLIAQKETYPTEEEVRSSINQSSVLNTKPLTKTSDQERNLSTYHPSHKTDILQTKILTYPMSNQYPLPFYQMGASEMISADPFDTHNGSPERSPCYHIGTIMTTPPDLMNSHTTVPLHHMGTVQETTKSQIGDFAKNTEIYQPEMSSFVSGFSSHDQQRRQNFQNQINGIATNLHKSASTCQCCCHAQSQSQSSHPPAFGLKNRRPSVIMVPTSWSNTSSGDSHVPLKADAPYIHQSETQMDDSDSTDKDEIEEKYFRANIDGKTARFKLRKEDWEKIPIKKFPSGGRLLSGDWVKIFLSKVKGSNPWCSLRFHNNHVRSENSRKMHSAAFFRGSAECKRPECNVKVQFVILKEKGKYVDVTYVGNVCHSSQPDGSGVRNIKNRNKNTRRNYSS